MSTTESSGSSVPAPGGGTDSPGEYPPTHYTAPPGASRLLLVRHAAPVAYRPRGRRDQLNGQDDPPLSARGRQQAELVGRHLARAGVDAVYSSPLSRAVQTAGPLAAALGVQPALVAELREVHLGQWEGGVVHQRLNERDPLWEVVLERERWDAIPGAEPNEALRERVRAALTAIHGRHRDQTVAIFTHDGVIAAALSLATGSRAFAFSSAAHASTSELVIEPGDRWRLRSFNSADHLCLEGGR